MPTTSLSLSSDRPHGWRQWCKGVLYAALFLSMGAFVGYTFFTIVLPVTLVLAEDLSIGTQYTLVEVLVVYVFSYGFLLVWAGAVIGTVFFFNKFMRVVFRGISLA